MLPSGEKSGVCSLIFRGTLWGVAPCQFKESRNEAGSTKADSDTLRAPAKPAKGVKKFALRRFERSGRMRLKCGRLQHWGARQRCRNCLRKC